MAAPRPGAGFQTEIYSYTDPTVLIDILPRRTQLACMNEVKNVGGGSVTVLANDPKILETPALTDYQNVAKVRLDGRVIGAFIVQNKQIVNVSQSEASGEAYELSGEGLRGWFRQAVVHPLGGLKTDSPTSRRFSFTSPRGSWYKTADWKAPTPRQQYNMDPNPGPWGTAPGQWPDVPSAWWIWGSNSTAGPTTGVHYFRYEFTVPSGTSGKHSLFAAGDDHMIVYLDGEQIMSTEDGEWSATIRSDFTLAPGAHILAFAVTHKDLVGGLIAALFRDNILLTSTGGLDSANWRVNPDPAQTPGWTPGEILNVLMDEAQDRGVRFPGWLTRTYTNTHASNGAEWGTTLDWVFDVGTELIDVLSQLEEVGCDIWIDPDTLALHMTAQRGADLSVQTATAEPVALRIGKNLRAADQKGKSELKNTLAVRTDTGWITQQDSATPSISRYGRIEGLLSTGLSSSLSQVVSKSVFDQKALPWTSSTYALEAVPGAVPYEDFGVGDWILAPNDKRVMERVRVLSLSVSESNKTGRPEYAIEFGTIAEDMEDRFNRWLKALNKGSLSGSVLNSAPVTTRPPSTGTQVPDDIDRRVPQAPTGVTVNSTAYIDNTGKPIGQIDASWSAVTNATNGTSLDISYYEVAIRLNVTGAPWSIVTAVEATEARYSPLDVSTSIQVKVRARGVYSPVPGLWSSAVTLTVADDTIPPPVPSKPNLSTRLGTIRVQWDGQSASGGGMPKDFVNTEVAMGTTATPTTIIDVLTGSGAVIVTDQPYGSLRYFRFRSVDRSGNRSDWSVVDSIATVPLVDTDLIQTTLNTQFEAANDRIDDLVDNVIPDVASQAAQAVSETAAQVAAAEAVATALANGISFFQPTPPTTDINGAIWYDTDDDYKPYRWHAPFGVGNRTNPIANSSFETGTSGWAQGGTSGMTRTVTRPTDGGVSGTGYMRNLFVGTQTGAFYIMDTARSIPTGGRAYTSSMYVRSDKAMPVRVRVWWYSDAGATSLVGTPATSEPFSLLAGTWTRIHVTSPSPSTAIRARVSVYFDAGTMATNTSFDIDAALLDESALLRPYFDGSSDSLVTSWVGTAFNSASNYVPRWVEVRDQSIVAAAQAASSAATEAAAALQAAQNAHSVALTADSRVTASTSAPVAADATGRPEGALWYRYTGNALVGAWRLVSGAWMAAPLDRTFIPSLDIGTGTFGDLDGLRIKARTILAESLAVGARGNMIPWFVNSSDPAKRTASPHIKFTSGAADPVISTTVFRTGAASVLFSDPTVPAGVFTETVQLCPTSPASNGRFNDWDVEPGKEYHITAWVRGNGSTLPKVRWLILFATTAGGFTNVVGPELQLTSPHTWQRMRYTFTAPASASSVYVRIQQDQPGSFFLDEPDMRPTVSGVLIENGAITADKVNAESVAAGLGQFIKIQAGNIEANAVTSDAIQAGAISAEKIASHSITADKLVVGPRENLIPWFVEAEPRTVAPHAKVRGTGTDPLIETSAATSRSGSAHIVFRDDSVAAGTVTNTVRLNSGSTAVNGRVDEWNTVPGEPMFASAWVRAGGTYSGVIPRVRLAAYFQDASGTYLASAGGGYVTLVYDPWQKITLDINPPAGAASMYLTIQQDQPGIVRVDDPELRFMTPGEVIVDGSITATKVAANSITGDHITGTAIDGKTITGATVRTAVSGSRVQLNANGLDVYEGSSLMGRMGNMSSESGWGLEVRDPIRNQLAPVSTTLFGARGYEQNGTITYNVSNGGNSGWNSDGATNDVAVFNSLTGRFIVVLSARVLWTGRGGNWFMGMNIANAQNGVQILAPSASFAANLHAPAVETSGRQTVSYSRYIVTQPGGYAIRAAYRVEAWAGGFMNTETSIRTVSVIPC